MAKPWMLFLRGPVKKHRTVGVLTFEISILMSKTIDLYQSLDEDRVANLRDETLNLEGVRKLVSDEDDFLLALALAESIESVHLLSRAVSRLGTRCSDPIFRRFDRVFDDLIKNDSDLRGLLEYPSGKKAVLEIKRMERFVAASSDLYRELEALADLESDLRRIKAIPERTILGANFAAFRKRVLWQRRVVKKLRDASVWNRDYDFVAMLLARALFSIVARIKLVFGFRSEKEKSTGRLSGIYYSVSGLLQPSLHPNVRRIRRKVFASGPLRSNSAADTGKNHPRQGIWGHFSKSSKGSMVQDNILSWHSIIVRDGEEKEEELKDTILNTKSLSLVFSEPRRRFLKAPPSTLGAAALALHYANVIIVIEKLSASPNLIGMEVRDELYSMLPWSVRASLRLRLSSYAKNLGSSVYDPALAEEWREAMRRILEWLAPLAHNMIKWQSDRSFEKQHLVSKTDARLIQTLYYANQAKAEAAITELLVGLNYLWRYGRELKAKALLGCAGSRSLVAAGRRRRGQRE